MSPRLLLVAIVSLLGALPAEGAGKKYALLVGVKEYDSATLTPLKYTENDAEEMAKVLKQAGYAEVVVLTSTRGKKDKAAAPTAANIRDHLAKLSKKVKRDDLLLIGLSGHGLMWPVVDPKTKASTDESFFCPADAKPQSEQTLEKLKETMLPLKDLFRTLDESGAGVRLLLVDACRNEVKAEGRNFDVDNLPRATRGTAALFSCKSGERAFEAEKLGHGIFFYHVIQGLRGRAKNKAEQVSWPFLKEYVVENVSADVPRIVGEGAKQTPHEMVNIEGRSPILIDKVNVSVEAERLFQAGRSLLLAEKGKLDHKKAFEQFKQAAELGHPLAAGELAVMFYYGRAGAPLSVERAAALIREYLPAIKRKANDGDPEAMNLMGDILIEGIATEKDEQGAAKWYRSAADKGNLHAMNKLGTMYRNKRGGLKGDKEAVRLFRQAANKGLPIAMVNLGTMYAAGRVIGQEAADGQVKGTPDPVEALRLFHRAAAKESGPAMYHIGLMTENGEGTKLDRVAALKWYKRAEELGVERAKEKVKELEKK